MGNYYVKGGSKFDGNGSDCKVYVYLDMNGYDESLYESRDDGDLENSDPYWRLGSPSGGDNEVEIGLHNKYRIKIDATGIYGWDEVLGTWRNLLNSIVPAGVFFPYGSAVAPNGYLLCDGSAVSRTTYANLFAAIGTSYGVGDGSTTFNVPDLVDVFVRGETTPGNTGGSDNAILVYHRHKINGTDNHSGGSYWSRMSYYGNWDGGPPVSYEGESATGKNKPAYVSAVFIIKI